MQIFAPFMLKRKNRVVRSLALILPLLCLVVLLAQTAVAQNTYVITDGDQVTVHTSYASNPETVLHEAGVELEENDFYTTADVDGVSEITVQREQAVKIDYCGRTITATSYGEPLQAVLDRLGIQVNSSYSLSHSLDTVTYDGMEVVIGSVINSEETYTVEIPYEVIRCEDPTLAAGEEQVRTAGVAGQMLCTAQVVYKNGEEYSRIVVEESVIQPATDEVVAVGSGLALTPQEEEKPAKAKPLDAIKIDDGTITLPSGEVLTYTHSGIFKGTAYTHGIGGVDFITATGTTVHHGTVAVDPDVVPYGTRMFIVTNDGEYVYGLSTAEDCGGGVNGNHVDLYFPSTYECFQFGVRECTIYFLGQSKIWS